MIDDWVKEICVKEISVDVAAKWPGQRKRRPRIVSFDAAHRIKMLWIVQGRLLKR